MQRVEQECGGAAAASEAWGRPCAAPEMGNGWNRGSPAAGTASSDARPGWLDAGRGRRLEGTAAACWTWTRWRSSRKASVEKAERSCCSELSLCSPEQGGGDGGGALRRDGDAGEGVEHGRAGWVASAGAMARGGEAAARSCDIHGGAREEHEGRRLLEAADDQREEIGRM